MGWNVDVTEGRAQTHDGDISQTAPLTAYRGSVDTSLNASHYCSADLDWRISLPVDIIASPMSINMAGGTLILGITVGFCTRKGM